MFIRRAKFLEMKALLENHQANLAQIKKHLDNAAILMSVERQDRLNIFTFVRDGKITQIKTMGLLGDDFNQWQKDLLK